jgi:hypothetical protein
MLASALVTMRRLLGAARFGMQTDDMPEQPVPGANLIYRLKAWPQLPDADRTAEVYRMLSVMSSRPLSRQWILSHTRMQRQQLEELLLHLIAEGSVEVIDPARFAGREPCRA